MWGTAEFLKKFSGNLPPPLKYERLAVITMNIEKSLKAGPTGDLSSDICIFEVP